MELDGQEWGVMRVMLDRGDFSKIKQFSVDVNILQPDDESDESLVQYGNRLQMYVKILEGLTSVGFKKWRTFQHDDITFLSPVSGLSRSLKYTLGYIRSP